MIIGIYSRILDEKESVLFTQIEEGLRFMLINGYTGCKLYQEKVPNEFTDISERIVLNQLTYDIQMGNINAVYVNDIKLFSTITVKILQVIIALQELGTCIHHSGGCFYTDKQNIKFMKKQFEENWKRINEISKGIDFGG